MSMRILAIDPGNIESAYVLMDEDYRPIEKAKALNDIALDRIIEILSSSPGSVAVVIEMISHYGSGSPVGATVFDTCIFIGRIIQAISPYPYELVKRAAVKSHICGKAHAKDSWVTQALVDRFAKNTCNHGKGTKKEQGWFYGFSADVWQAYALAVTYADRKKEST
jgi:hypothetical protein